MGRVANRVSLYRVSLGCAAAPGLGCGVRAKPLLLALERAPAVAEAWLNRQGTLLAVVWAKASTPKLYAGSVPPVLKKKGMVAKELVGKARGKALEDFTTRRGWYQGARIDSLSKKEAEIIARRLVHRVRAAVRLSDEQAESLLTVFAPACMQELTRNAGGSARLRKAWIATAILNAGRAELDGAGIVALRRAVARGHRPLPGEK